MNKCYSPCHLLRVITHHVGYRKLLIISPGLLQLCKGFSAEVGEGERGRGGEAYYRTKKTVFITKLHSSADQNAF